MRGLALCCRTLVGEGQRDQAGPQSNGSLQRMLAGSDQANAQAITLIRVPGATLQSIGLRSLFGMSAHASCWLAPRTLTSSSRDYERDESYSAILDVGTGQAFTETQNNDTRSNKALEPSA